MPNISRRSALTTGAAAITTGAIATPLALKAAGVKAALAGDSAILLPTDPVLLLKRERDAHWNVLAAGMSENRQLDADRVGEIEYQIFQTPATSIEGVACKLRLWTYQSYEWAEWAMSNETRCPIPADYDPGYDSLLIVSALCDLERMHGRAPS